MTTTENNERGQPLAVPLERPVRRWVAITVAVLDGATFEVTGKKHGITRERVWQIVRYTLRKTYRHCQDRTWSALQPIDELRANADARNAVLALLEGPPNAPMSGRR